MNRNIKIIWGRIDAVEATAHYNDKHIEQLKARAEAAENQLAALSEKVEYEAQHLMDQILIRTRRVCQHPHLAFTSQEPSGKLYATCPDCEAVMVFEISDLTDDQAKRAIVLGFRVPGGIRHG